MSRPKTITTREAKIYAGKKVSIKSALEKVNSNLKELKKIKRLEPLGATTLMCDQEFLKDFHKESVILSKTFNEFLSSYTEAHYKIKESLINRLNSL